MKYESYRSDIRFSGLTSGPFYRASYLGLSGYDLELSPVIIACRPWELYWSVLRMRLQKLR